MPEIDYKTRAAAAAAFISTPLGVEHNGTDLTVGSALAWIDMDAWDVADELSALPRRAAASRLAALLRRVELAAGLPHLEDLAAKVVGRLPRDPRTLKSALGMAVEARAFWDMLLCLFVVGLVACCTLVAALNHEWRPALVAAAAGIASTGWLVLRRNPWLAAGHAALLAVISLNFALIALY